MSAKAETLAVPARHVASYVLAIILALAIGATAGSVITQAIGADSAVTLRQELVGIAPWDQQRLDAMDGRQQAEAVTVDGLGTPWDQGKLDAIAGFQASAGDRGQG